MARAPEIAGARAWVAAANKAAELEATQLARHAITAPRDGEIVELPVELGEVVFTSERKRLCVSMRSISRCPARSARSAVAPNSRHAVTAPAVAGGRARRRCVCSPHRWHV